MAISTVNIGSAPNDGTGDPLRTAFNKLNTNFLNITADGGDEITVVDPTTSTDATLNTALQNIFDSGGGATPDLQAVTDVGNTITDGTDTNTVSANGVNVTDGTNQGLITKDEVSVQNASDITQITAGAVLVSDSTITDFATLYKDRIQVNSVDYPLPTGVSSQIATLADITGGVSDGDKGDITVSSSGTVWTIDNGVVTDAKLASQKVDTLLNDNVDSSIVVGTVANTILKSYLIPANTLAVGDTIDLKTVCSKVGTSANCNFRLYTNVSNSLTGASALAMVTPTSTNLYFSLDRTYTLKTGNTLESFPVTGTTVTDESPSTLAISNTAFNPAVDNYFIIAIQPNNALDSFRQTLCYITRMKQKATV